MFATSGDLLKIGSSGGLYKTFDPVRNRLYNKCEYINRYDIVFVISISAYNNMQQQLYVISKNSLGWTGLCTDDKVVSCQNLF